MSTPLSWDRDGADWPLREYSRFVSVGHLRWHIQRMGPSSGTARRVWLLHGTGAATHTWRDVGPLLAQHHEVVSVDLPGHGFTQGAADADLTLEGMASALLALREAIVDAGNGAPSTDAWVGHSAGAAVALEILRRSPRAVSTVIGLNGALLPWGGPASGFFMPVARALATHPWTVRFFAWSARRPGTVEALLRDTGSIIDDRGISLYQRLVDNEVHVRSVLKMMAQWELEPFARMLPSLHGHVVLITGSQDHTVPPSVSARAARLIPGAQHIALPRWGHLGHEEAPAEWASLIQQVLAWPRGPDGMEARGGVEPP